MAEAKRWKATIFYRMQSGIYPEPHFVEEIEEMQEIIERGPHWDTIERVEIRLNRAAEDGLMTIEQSEVL